MLGHKLLQTSGLAAATTLIRAARNHWLSFRARYSLCWTGNRVASEGKL